MGTRKSRPVTALIVGAGQRGFAYATYGLDLPEKLKVVGVADPKDFQRERIQKQHAIATENVFTDWKQAVERDKFANCVFICTPDRLHKECALAFAKKGYHLLLEKPMGVTYAECEEIVRTCEASGVYLAVCHVLRYTPQARKIKEAIDEGVIGDVVNIQLIEPVGYYHFAHSYVRGNWRNSESSSFSLLAKSCHDIDLISYWMGARTCAHVSSFGSLKHFTAKNKPEGATSRCLDCPVERSCPYSAKKMYIDYGLKQGHHGFVCAVSDVMDIEHVTEALRTGPYGRCVYECDNNVCDNQVVNMQFDDGATASFTMIAFSEKICVRTAKIFGTKGQLSCDFDMLKVDRFDFVTHEPDYYDLRERAAGASKSRLRGHGGADFHAVDSFIFAVAENDPSKILTGPRETLESHRLCFLAEQARLENTVVSA